MMPFYANLSLLAVIFFCFLEIVEVKNGGLNDYVQDLWNVMDWANYLIFFKVYWDVQATLDAIHNPDFSCALCSGVGYFDDWKVEWGRGGCGQV